MPTNEKTLNLLKEKVEETDVARTIEGKERNKQKWAAMSVEFAVALYTLAEEESDPNSFTLYQQAISVYEEVLEIYTMDTDPQEWPKIVLSFSTVLRTYAKREGGDSACSHLDHAKKLLNKAIIAFHQSVSVPRTVENICIPAFFYLELAHVAITRSNIDHHGNRLAFLKEGKLAFVRAADYFRQHEDFNGWVIAQIGQARIWKKISEVSKDEDEMYSAFLNALPFWKAALEYYTEDSHPIEWGYFHAEYGSFSLQLGLLKEKEECSDFFFNAVRSLRIAVESKVVRKSSSLLAISYTGLASALFCYTNFSPQLEIASLVEEGCRAYNNAIKRYSSTGCLLEAAFISGQMGKRLVSVSARVDQEDATKYQIQAIAAFQQSLVSVLKEQQFQEWRSNLLNLCTIVQKVKEEKRDIQFYENAREIYTDVLKQIENSNEPLCSHVLAQIGFVCIHLGERDKSEEGMLLLKNAGNILDTALKNITWSENFSEYFHLKNVAGSLFFALALRSKSREERISFLKKSRLYMQEVIENKNYSSSKLQEEWISAHWIYALVLQGILMHDAATDEQKDYMTVEKMYCTILDWAKSAEIQEQLNIKGNFALFLLMKAKKLPYSDNKALLCKALNLFSEVYKQAIKEGQIEIARVAEEQLEHYGKKRTKNVSFFLKILSFFKIKRWIL